MLHAELLPVSGSGLDDLDQARLSDYLLNVIGDSEVPAIGAAWEQRLCGLGFMMMQADGTVICTIAGLVLFGRSPRRSLRQAGVRWMAFDGDGKDYKALDDTIVDGPLVALWRGKPGDG